MINYIPRRFTIVRDRELCIDCGCCVRQCSNECHSFGPDGKTVVSHSQDCVACHRRVDLCPTGALRIEKYVCDYRDNANWTPRYQQEICRQANTGGVLLSAMGNPQPYPIYWDKILLNASQVTNPSIDPLREPMEIRTILGRKPAASGAQGQVRDQNAASGDVGDAHYVLCHELWLHQPECPKISGHGCQEYGHAV